MTPKIRYRLCFNYGGRLNADGRSPVAVEARQGSLKISPDLKPSTAAPI